MHDTTVPVQIAADAAARVDELGMRRELDQMIEHAIQTAPGLRAVRVTLEPDPDFPENGLWVVLEAHREPTSAGSDLLGQWGEWRGATFSPEVCWHIKMWPTFREPDGR
jgi:hypothetical protein